MWIADVSDKSGNPVGQIDLLGRLIDPDQELLARWRAAEDFPVHFGPGESGPDRYSTKVGYGRVKDAGLAARRQWLRIKGYRVGGFREVASTEVEDG